MAQFQFANVPGQFQQGQQFTAQNAQNAENLKQSQFAGKQATDLDALRKNIRSAVELKAVPDTQKPEFLKNKIATGEAEGRDMTQSKKALELVASGRFDELNQGTEQLLEVATRMGDISAPTAKKSGQFTLGAGQQRFNEQGGVIATGAATPTKLSSLQQKVAAEGLDPLTPAGQARAREITQGSRTDPSLKPSDQQLINKANEGQLASSVFANRVGAANEVLANLEAIPNFDPTSLQTAFFEAVPGGNLALSDNEQLFSQAKRDFITAVLRKESGAAIGKDEFINEDKKFFPQVGDGKAVLKQKALGRKRAFENLKAQSKGVFDVQFGKKTQGTGGLSDAEKAELQQLRSELGQ